MRNVLIVGGAAMGWATAHHLLCVDPDLRVIVIERDPTLQRSSTMLSDGNVRVQFNLEENIAISRYAMECLDTFADDMTVGDFVPDPAMRHQGNLFLVDESGRAAAQAGLAAQHLMGCDTEWLDMDAVVERFPSLASNKLVGGSFGPRDGSVDPSAVVEGYRRKSIEAGATQVEGTVVSIGVSADAVHGVQLSDGSTMEAATVVVCAGAWSGELLATAGVDIPVEPVMRTVYVVAGEVPGADSLPSFFLPAGVYVIPEHDGTFLIGLSSEDDPVGYEFTPSPRSRFYDVLWPELATTIPSFDQLEVIRSWAGLYAQNRLDANAIVGEWPGVSGLYQATGFSGHGFQQCHAVGRHLAELVTEREPSLDLTRLGPERIIAGEPYAEHAGRII